MSVVDMAGQRLLVTVESPSGRHSLSLPGDALVADLLPGIVKACEGDADPAGWTLAPQGETVVSGSRRLGELGIYSGAVMKLTPPPADLPPPPAPSLAQAPPPPPPRIDSMSASDYRHMLDRAIQWSRPRSSNVIAVIASQPGAGGTTVTALLSTLLRSLRQELLVAVDANPDSGALSQWLVPDRALQAPVYRSLLDPTVTPDIIEAALVSAAPQLSVLPAPLDSASVRVGDVGQWARLIEHLRRLRHIVVVDCGPVMQRDAARAAVASADHIVFVRKAEPAINVAPHFGKPAVVVANQSPRRTRLRPSREGLPEVTLSVDQRAAALLKRRGFDWADAPGDWQEAVRELAAILVGPG